MTIQYSVAVRNAGLDARETAIGASPKLLIFSSPKPANCAAADPAGLLMTMDLPADYLAAASNGVKAKSGTWTGTGSGAGDAASFRIKDATNTTCHMQGTVTATGGGGDMTLDNINIAVGQAVTVSTFQLTAGNA